MNFTLNCRDLSFRYLININWLICSECNFAFNLMMKSESCVNCPNSYQFNKPSDWVVLRKRHRTICWWHCFYDSTHGWDWNSAVGAPPGSVENHFEDKPVKSKDHDGHQWRQQNTDRIRKPLLISNLVLIWSSVSTTRWSKSEKELYSIGQRLEVTDAMQNAL